MVKKVKTDNKKHDECVVDYSDVYSSFYEIFAGVQVDPKTFDLSYVVRDTRNMYASFINLLDSNAVVMKQKFKFEKAPLEMGYRDYGIFPNYFLKNIANDIDDLEAKTKNGELSKKQVILEAAVEQHKAL